MSKSEQQKRPDQTTFDVIYYKLDGTVKSIDKVKRAPFRGNPGLKEIQVFQEQLVREFVEFNGAIGSLFVQDKVWSIITQLGSILYVVGRDKPGIDIEALAEADDLPQLAQIFFSESFNDSGDRERDDEGATILAKPSKIAKVHGLDFYDPLFRASQEKRNREIQGVYREELNGKVEEPQNLQEIGKLT
jgi:hypothetical protein